MHHKVTQRFKIIALKAPQNNMIVTKEQFIVFFKIPVHSACRMAVDLTDNLNEP